MSFTAVVFFILTLTTLSALSQIEPASTKSEGRIDRSLVCKQGGERLEVIFTGQNDFLLQRYTRNGTPIGRGNSGSVSSFESAIIPNPLGNDRTNLNFMLHRVEARFSKEGKFTSDRVLRYETSNIYMQDGAIITVWVLEYLSQVSKTKKIALQLARVNKFGELLGPSDIYLTDFCDLSSHLTTK